MTAEITIGDYLLGRLKELGIEHIFGVPGDYNLGFLDQISHFSGIEWVGTCNELNGAYASDGYARVKGAGALLTTFGVGELSAINGIAGSYAEYAPVVNLVGLPATTIQANKSLMHHTLGDGRFTVFSDMFKDITVAIAILTKENAASEIDRVLKLCWLKKRPVYIGIPSDVSFLKINGPEKKLDLSYPPSNQDAVIEACERAATYVKQAKTPIVLIDLCSHTHPMKKHIQKFLEKTNLPFATMSMGKAVIDESLPQYLGIYNGDFSDVGVQDKVENSDCIISFGALLSDFNTGGFTTKLNANATIEIHSYSIRVKQSNYENVIYCDSIPMLTEKLNEYHCPEKNIQRQNNKLSFEDKAITHDRLWKLLSQFLKKDTIVIAETGTSMFGTLEMQMPNNSLFISQTLWASIGYSVGALLGVCMAAPDRQVVLFVGDGSFQLTAQELSTIQRHHLNPTIFLLNNDGYTIERVIHGEKMQYNDIQPWKYSELPKIFGDASWSIRVNTEKELEQALRERNKHPQALAFIEIIMDRMDAPDVLVKVSKVVAERNKYSA